MTDYISKLNDVSIGGDILPDNWGNNGVRLANDITIGASKTLTYDISQYIPDSNYDYEVMGIIWTTSDSTNGRQPTLAIKNGDNEFKQQVGSDYVRSGATVIGGGNFRILVRGSNRTFKVENIRSYSYNIWVIASFFRQVGSNV